MRAACYLAAAVDLATTPVSPVLPGDVLAGKYVVERVLGAGAMGVVVVAMHTQLEQRVAIKFLLPEVLDNPEASQRFAREAKASARIRSEHVARVLDVATLANGEPYMVMEYLDGQDLAAVLEARGALPLSEAVDYVLQALEALCEAHLAGIVHRDLKPGNMFLARRVDGSPVVKILDFGISKIDTKGQQGMTHTQAVLGSPLYMAPEQMRTSRSVDQRADLWSMGVVLYQLVTNAFPFTAESITQLISTVMFDPAPRVTVTRPDLPPGIDDVVLRCLEKEPAARFQNVGELAAALAPFAPPTARISVERITRMMRSSGVDLPAVAAPAHVVPISVPATHASGSFGLRSTVESTPPRRSAVLGIGIAAAAIIAVAAVGVLLLLRRGAPDAAGGAAAISSPAATTSVAPSAAPVPSAIPSVVETLAPPAPPPPSPSAVAVETSAPKTATPPAPPPTTPRRTPSAAPKPAAPPPANPPGESDFGGRH
jgi:serine/threonine-protein kinase